MQQRTDRHFVRIALPDHIHMAHRHIQRFPVQYRFGDFQQHTIFEVDGVVQPVEQYWCAVDRRKVLKHPLTAKA
ncbi:hypothetical protein D3C87_1909260 [compost metagenome]